MSLEYWLDMGSTVGGILCSMAQNHIIRCSRIQYQEGIPTVESP